MISGLFLVRLKGFEPPTYWFVASHSIQLSYSRVFLLRKQLVYYSAFYLERQV